MSNTISTWIIAGAAIANVFVYLGLWLETRKQISLTRDLFLESNRPALCVSIKKCEYSETEARFKMRIVTKNSGSAAANRIKLRISVDGFNDVKNIGPIAIQPHNKVIHTFAIPMNSDTYSIAQTDGHRFNLLVEGPYQGPLGHEYSYGEKQEYNGELKRFVPYWAK